MTLAELRKVGATIQDYFNSDVEPLHVEATINGTTVDLFEDDEVAHMADVKRLFGRTYRLQWASGIVLLATVGYAAYRERRRSIPIIARWLARGAVLVSLAIAGIGLASTVAFNQVFLLFHYIGFPQGNFTFDSQTDYLVRVFPLGFWSDITFFIGGMTLVEAALVYLAARLVRRRVRAG
jgi:integral membrane protein (TIGR01906 family)